MDERNFLIESPSSQEVGGGGERDPADQPRVAVLIPCHNEAASVSTVVADFVAALPQASIYVFDNASTDDTAKVAAEVGAIVCYEGRKGKGHVIRRMFADVEADIYLMVDGDATYDASAAPEMVHRVWCKGMDMVVGARVPARDDGDVYRRGHSRGNVVFTTLVRLLFGGDFSDVFSGYRAFSRRFVKSLPVSSEGFEIETELSTHAVRVFAACDELPTAYGSRGENSTSKLRTYRDGARIFLTMARLFEEMRPFQFFGICFLLLTVVSLALGIPVVGEFVRTGRVPRFPTAILAGSIQVVAFVCLTAGIILRSVGRARDEQRRLAYLQVGGPSVASRSEAAARAKASSFTSTEAGTWPQRAADAVIPVSRV